MATPADPVLENKLLGLNRYRNASWQRMGASLVPSVAAGLQGGQQAAMATANSFYPKPKPGIQKMDVLAMKKDAIDSMVAAQEKMNDRRAGLIEKLNAADDIAKALLNAVQGYASSDTGAMANASSTLAQARVSALNKYSEEMMKLANRSMTDNGPAVKAAFEALSGQLTPEGVNEAAFQASVLNAVKTMSATDVGALYGMLEAEAASVGMEGGIGGVLEGVARAAGDASPAAKAMHEFDSLRAEAADLSKGAVAEAMGTYEQVMKQLSAGSAGAGHLLKVWQSFISDPTILSMLDPKAKADAIAKQLALIEPTEANGAAPDQVEAFLKLLDGIDTEEPAGNLAEARQKFLQDPDFQAWMKQNGYTDPGLALKELRRSTRQIHHQRRQETLAKIRDDRRGSAAAAPPPSPASVAASTGAPPAPKAEGSPVRVFFADDGKTYILSEGAIRQATDADQDVVNAATDTDQVEDQLALDSAKKETQKPAVALPTEAPVPAEPAAKRPPSLRMLQDTATFVGTHPAAGMNMATKAIRTALANRRQKREQGETDMNTVNALLHPSIQ